LRELIADGLIPQGVVDDRSITEVQPADLVGYVQCHFFAGIGGWSLALQLAGWPSDREVWTGSCPCQPFSSAGKRKGTADDRHLWPVFAHLISKRKPAVVFGEQVASKDGLGWLDGVFTDLETADYACGASDLPAAGVGAPHIRQRLYWVGVPNGNGRKQGWPTPKAARYRGAIESAGGVSGLGIALQPRLEGHSGDERDGHESRRIAAGEAGSVAEASTTHWSDFDIISCRDGKARRVKSGLCVLAHGVPGRVGLLRGYGNAIVPEAAAEFVKAYLDVESV